jgi:hypothetical protein
MVGDRNFGGWWGIPQQDGTHIVPEDDLREHDLSMQCWCTPQHMDGLKGDVIVHNAMDKRELYEQGELDPS